MRREVLFSLGLHGVLLAFAVVGLPYAKPKIDESLTPIPVNFVADIGEVTNVVKAEHKVPNPTPPPAPPKEEVKEQPHQDPPPPPKPERRQPEPQPPQVAEVPAPRPPVPPKPVQPDLTPVPTPEPKPELKPEPKVPVPEPKPDLKSKPFDPTQLALLKDVRKTRDESTTPQEQRQQIPVTKRFPSIYTPDNSQSPMASDQLSESELGALRAQVANCWNVPSGARNADNLIVTLRVEISQDRRVVRAEVLDNARYLADSFYRAAADSAMRALRNPDCTPLRLPPEGYGRWHSITFDFDPKGML